MSSLQAPPPDASSPATLRVAIVVPFLNEAALMPRFLGSMLAQTRRPDLLLLVDDGSTDASKGMAAEFAAQHDFARVLQRPPRPPAKDRLATAAELQAFHWGVEQLDEPFDVIAKVDADLEFAPRHVETLLAELAADPELGIVGCYLAVEEPTGIRREPSPAYHVRGPTKFYRRECLEAIEPLPEILGWDGFDRSVRAAPDGRCAASNAKIATPSTSAPPAPMTAAFAPTGDGDAAPGATAATRSSYSEPRPPAFATAPTASPGSPTSGAGCTPRSLARRASIARRVATASARNSARSPAASLGSLARATPSR